MKLILLLIAYSLAVDGWSYRIGRRLERKLPRLRANVHPPRSRGGEADVSPLPPVLLRRSLNFSYTPPIVIVPSSKMAIGDNNRRATPQKEGGTNSSLWSSFLETSDETKMEQAAAIAKLAPYCEHGVADSSWLTCDRSRTKNGYVSAGGSYGAVLFGSIMNNGAHKIYVYRNLSLKPGVFPRPEFLRTHLVEYSSTPLCVVVKVNTQSTERSVRRLHPSVGSAIELESRRSREAAAMRFFPNGPPISPAIYDIQLAETGRVHPLQTFAMFQECIKGETAFSLMYHHLDAEQQSMVDNLERVFLHFYTYLDETKKTSGGPDNEAVRRASLKFRNAVHRAQKEMWLRARLRVTLISVVHEGARRMWQAGMLHCDSHWNNVMLLKETITTDTALLAAKREGLTIIPSLRFFLSDTVVITKPEADWLRKGLDVYHLKPNNVRWIDSANFLDLRKALENIPGQDVKQKRRKLVAPCVTERHMPEDIVELVRMGGETVLGKGDASLETLFRKAKQVFEKQNSVSTPSVRIYQLYKTYLPIFESRGSLHGTPLAENPQILALWESLFNSVAQLTAEVSKANNVLTRASRSIEFQPVTHSCRVAREKLGRSRLVFRRREGDRWRVAAEVAGDDCNVEGWLQGVDKVQQILAQAGREFPPYAQPVLY